ncbi:MAG: cyclic nucleotide-binding domain-containing protein [Desulfobacteraceae bacterium]|nr:cyclic nucleotide-binding domain-containing protein [Desulfobacteraceae bacterium]
MEKTKTGVQTEDAAELESCAFFSGLESAIAAGAREVRADFGTVGMTLGLPPLGEGDNSLVYPLNSLSLVLPERPEMLCVKVAKRFPACRKCLIQEEKTTNDFLAENIRVPRMHFLDAHGRFAIKEFVEGESVTSIYMRFETFPVRTQSIILRELEGYLSRMLDLFHRRPECKVSISPNNIYLLTDGDRLRLPIEFVLIDPGPSPNKRYDGFNFDKYWNEMLPNRISKYKRTGYLQWILPRQVSREEYDEAREFEILRDMSDEEVQTLMGISTTQDFDVGQVILKEGTIGDSFYLILEGEVILHKKNQTEASWDIRLKSGSSLGEMGFLLEVPRSMTATAASHCKLIEIPAEGFKNLLDQNRLAPYKLLRNISVILAERLYRLDQAHQKLLDNRGEVPSGNCAAKAKEQH